MPITQLGGGAGTSSSAAASLPIGAKHGGMISNAADANNDITIQPFAYRDSTNAVDIVLTSAITKQLDATWSVGTDAGGLDTGAKASNTWYYLWAIYRSDTAVVDVLFSTSASSPTMPTGYTHRALLWAGCAAVLTNGSGDIRAFRQNGDTFRWAVAINDYDSGTNPGNGTSLTVSVPPVACRWVAEIRPQTGSNSITFSSGVQDSGFFSTNSGPLVIPMSMITDNRQITWVTASASNFTEVSIRTYGWDYLGN